MGLELRNPLVASASPLSQTLDGIRRLEDGGAGAVVLSSLFEEQMRREAEAIAHLGRRGTESFAEALDLLSRAAEDWPARAALPEPGRSARARRSTFR